ncbi:ATP-depentend DNA helicase [Reticulomyxa filosa]|uniref:DNA 3'-5' helicase n=1 Tax=Reticulomyxa filosa TaxID=46433 RepID=X6MGY5_RETFI|nr:ATP-depentend DNA helicase [Reticulomyxa filosa]|eukprot:ETO13283.1 ATP-depentend DNA helicase [Reticulomyxa filosa]
MKERVNKILSEKKKENEKGSDVDVYCCTFHSFCHFVLKNHVDILFEWKTTEEKGDEKEKSKSETKSQLVIKNADECLELIHSIMKTMIANETEGSKTETTFSSDAMQTTATEIAMTISKAKNSGMNAKDFLKHVRKSKDKTDDSEIEDGEEVAAVVYVEYEQKLQQMRAVDFDDLLWKTYELFRSHKSILTHYAITFPHIIIDEYQDTNELQFLLVQLLVSASGGQSIMAVGDCDQSIFGWRGADHQQVITYFRDAFPNRREIVLAMNYRSTLPILSVANHIINQKIDTSTAKKQMKTLKFGGEKVHFEECRSDQGVFNAIYEASFVVEQLGALAEKDGKDNFHFGNCAVLYRSMIQSRVLEQKLIESHIPYFLAGHSSFLDKEEVQILVQYLKVVINVNDNDALAAIV